jgi:hypothetical protein
MDEARLIEKLHLLKLFMQEQRLREKKTLPTGRNNEYSTG